MRIFLLVMAVLGIVSLYLLTVATGHTSKLSEYFWWILGLNGAIILTLLWVVGQQLWWLYRDSRAQVFGSRLARRLMSMFALIALLPGIFVFAVSAQFIVHSINSWFGNDTEDALARSLNLSKLALDNALDNSFRAATQAQVQILRTLGGRQPASWAAVLNESEGVKNFQAAAVYDMKTRNLLARFEPHPLSGSLKGRVSESLGKEEILALQNTGSFKENISINGVLYSQVWLTIPERNAAVFFRQPVPQAVAQDAMRIEGARSRYAELVYAKNGLQTFFLLTLIVATLVSLLVAVAAAMYFARRFVAPLMLLSEATQAVSTGDFSDRYLVLGSDELGMLSSRFRHMTDQLRHARALEDKARHEQEAARLYLERVLENLTTGVMTFDAEGALIVYNQTAESILQAPLKSFSLSSWRDWKEDAEPMKQLIQAALNHAGQKAFECHYSPTDGATQKILLVKATSLWPHSTEFVLVFDDVTELVQAQKQAAWGEVAKRLAHEIRNPLTPIQLSAERLAMKLGPKLDQTDAAMLERATHTIVSQVGALKVMVEDFRNYARSANLVLRPLNLNALTEEVLSLYETSACTFETKFSKIAPMVLADATSLRQVLHNLIKNATEAALEADNPVITIETLLNAPEAILRISNSGKGFSAEILHRAFEPYITDKPTGTGLGLAVVKKIMDEHHGVIQLANRPDSGAMVSIRLPLQEQ